MIDPRLHPSHARLLWIGRVDHSLRALDPLTGRELWNLTVSELTPLFTPPRSSSSSASAGTPLSLSSPPPLDPASRAVLDVMGPGPGWGGAGSLVATPDGGLHRRDPATGRVSLLAPLGAAPVSAFVVTPMLGQGVALPLLHAARAERSVG